MKVSHYNIKNARLTQAKNKIKLALVSDLHANDPFPVLRALEVEKPDYILLAGDILELLDGSCDEKNERAFPIFSGCAKIAPAFYVTGNHEDGGTHSGNPRWKKIGEIPRSYTEENMKRILSSGVVYLENSYKIVDGIAFAGLASGQICKDRIPDLNFLGELSELQMPKILLCHHPEYYEKYIRELDIDLVVSGHAHGGQWRFFGHGVYAPGQGLLPKYTSGIYDGRLAVSRGLKPGRIIPRFFNPTEIVIIDIN